MSEAKEWVWLRNKATRKDVKVPVTDVQFAEMEARGHGSKLFTVLERKPINKVFVPRIAPRVPDEVKAPIELTQPVTNPVAVKGNAPSPEEGANDDAN